MVIEDGWRTRAACRTGPTNQWFPQKAGTAISTAEELLRLSELGLSVEPGPTDERAAKAICATCPVAGSCMATAAQDGVKDGVWGVGGQRRRRLRKLWLRSVADPTRLDTYERAIAHEVKLLRRTAERDLQPRHLCPRCARQGLKSWVHEGRHPEDTNGDGARCGYAVTYSRGCRCWACRFAHYRRLKSPTRTQASALLAA
jgi:hypothetical protein